MQCEVCGNEYRNCFTVTQGTQKYVFDCFECAIHALAPTCAHCGCKIVGHGISFDDEVFCCQHCVRMSQSAVDSNEDDIEEIDFEVDDEADDEDVDLDDEDVDDDDDDEVADEDEDADEEDEAPVRRRSTR